MTRISVFRKSISFSPEGLAEHNAVLRAEALEEAAETIEQINANHLTRQEVVAAIRALKERKL